MAKFQRKLSEYSKPLIKNKIKKLNPVFLPENDDQADLENQAIYQSISRLTGVDRPALVFRTIAASPGALLWCWRRIGPLYERGLLQEAGWRIGPALHLPSGLVISQEALDLVNISNDDKLNIVKALDAYNRVNPCNLIAIGVLIRALSTSGENRCLPAALGPPNKWIPPKPIIPVTTMVEPEKMSENVSRLIAQISLDQPSANEPALVPSLYRHLANVPSFLVLASVLLRPLLLQGQLNTLVNEVRAQAMQESQHLFDMFTARSDDATVNPERMEALFERFSWKIPEMIVVGEILRRALP